MYIFKHRDTIIVLENVAQCLIDDEAIRIAMVGGSQEGWDVILKGNEKTQAFLEFIDKVSNGAWR